MKSFILKWRNMMSAADVDIRERIFCKITSVGMGVAIVALLETLVVSDSWLLLFAMTILLASVIASIYLTVQLHKMDIGASILALVLAMIISPCIFFTNGGIEGGATVWFILNIVVTFLVFRGVRMYVFLVIDIVSEILWYVLGFYFPEMIIALPTRREVYLDSLFAVIAVGIALALMLRFHIVSYAQQRETVEWQKAELEKNNEAQTHFFASMSHELRTPINTIIGLNEMLLRENTDEKVLDYTRKVQGTSKLLLSLINDILDLSQLETKKMTIAENEYQTEELFSDLIDMAGTLAGEKHLDFRVEVEETIPKVLLGDRRRIQQIALNLLSNAVKYTQLGTVTLSIVHEKLENQKILLQITVRDTGLGIRKENLKSIYDVFRRVDQKENEKIEGSGLGLAITKQLLDLMGGDITVDSIYTKGSVFTVTIPQTVVDAAEIGNIMQNLENRSGERTNYEPSFAAGQARILVVDDNPTNAMIIAKLLEKTGMQIDQAHSGEECLQLTQNRFYHVILLDDRMPGKDGGQTLAEMRNQVNGMCKKVPVVALTANSASDAENYYLNLGFDAYMEKPVDTVLLEKMILSFLPDNVVEYVRENDNSAKEPVKPSETHRKKKIMVTTDCVAEIPTELLKQYEMEMMYLYIQTPEGRFADTIEIDIDNLNQYIANGQSKAHAVSVSVEEYEEFFAEQLLKAEEVIHISMSSGCGKSYGVAMAAAESFDHVHVVDSGHIAGGERMLALHAARMVKEGKTVEEIIAEVNRASKRVVSIFLLPNAAMFYREGYTNYFLYRMSESFNIHPILKIKKGQLKVVGCAFGSQNRSIRHFIRSAVPFQKRVANDDLFVSFVALNSKQRKFLDEEIMKRLPKAHIYSRKASLSCACNSGPGTVGISYYNTKPGMWEPMMEDGNSN